MTAPLAATPAMVGKEGSRKAPGLPGGESRALQAVTRRSRPASSPPSPRARSSSSPARHSATAAPSRRWQARIPANSPSFLQALSSTTGDRCSSRRSSGTARKRAREAVRPSTHTLEGPRARRNSSMCRYGRTDRTSPASSCSCRATPALSLPPSMNRCRLSNPRTAKQRLTWLQATSEPRRLSSQATSSRAVSSRCPAPRAPIKARTSSSLARAVLPA
mmetsp:Transcript_29588/g.40652  ORF Transcript_29588/g.40652 Transcript_29588/m.40652 type:complete len:219 (+) Transcript_29588:794-1450(+)